MRLLMRLVWQAVAAEVWRCGVTGKDFVARYLAMERIGKSVGDTAWSAALMRGRGLDYGQIGKELGISRERARQLVALGEHRLTEAVRVFEWAASIGGAEVDAVRDRRPGRPRKAG